uniref:AraC family transcriptional regulator n=1 Tax=Ruegeria arenilitoris TaxID=1173585 RepID=UPI0026707884|nr:AraC family transcriptional regulator [Ruegeria arenilitoris]
MGEAGTAARRAFGVGNEIARTIAYLANHLNKQVTIDDLADRVGMSRAVFHRRFKEATTVLSDEFEPVSVCRGNREPIRNKVDATRRERRCVSA